MSSTRAEETNPVLYRHVGCPYCERVVRVANELAVALRSRFVLPKHSSRGHVKHISGSRTVPVLVDPERGVTMSESANIVEYLTATYGDS